MKRCTHSSTSLFGCASKLESKRCKKRRITTGDKIECEEREYTDDIIASILNYIDDLETSVATSLVNSRWYKLSAKRMHEIAINSNWCIFVTSNNLVVAVLGEIYKPFEYNYKAKYTGVGGATAYMTWMSLKGTAVTAKVPHHHKLCNIFKCNCILSIPPQLVSENEGLEVVGMTPYKLLFNSDLMDPVYPEESSACDSDGEDLLSNLTMYNSDGEDLCDYDVSKYKEEDD